MAQHRQLVVGVALVAAVAGLIVGVALLPAATGQESAGEGRTGRFALVTGIRGNQPNTQTVYILDETNEVLLAFEYDARGRSGQMEIQAVVDLHRYIERAIELRAQANKGRKTRPITPIAPDAQ